jgi:small redox-active disulfide protein 2
MNIQVAGPGCPKCKLTEDHVRQACAQLGIDAEITHLTDPREFATLGVFFTPAVVVDGEVIESGHVPSVDTLKTLLSERG